MTAADDEIGRLVPPRDPQPALQNFGVRVDTRSMSMNAQLIMGYAVLWIVLLKTLFMRARLIPAECPRCGLLYERRELGGVICSCER